MSEFLDRISKLSPQRLALLADELNERLQAFERRRKVPLAIVGIGCRLPGGVNDPEGFWKLLSDGVDAVGEVPPSRWDVDEFYDRNPDTPGKMATRWGGFIEDIDQFDPKFFGIAPAEADSMDPQQRLLLETTWEALEHAGIAPAALAGTQTGVFVGICNGDYSQVALDAPRETITPYFAPGLSHAVAAGRISYVLGLQGPSLAVDTSCSASLVAVHLACQSLRLGESDVALTGGVNSILNQDITIALSQSKMMAPDGRCKAFSESANGFVRGEGCGMIVLKRLPDAIRDHNRILAVIRGSACNQDGRSSGLTAPNGPSQEAVVATALADAGLQPDDVDAVEAHGTGTALGDPIEAGALNAVFASRSSKSEPLFVGSVKTNLGHLESAAGIAGLIKLVLSIQHGKLPASLHFEKPNSRIEWDRLPMKVPTQLQTWNRRGEKRVGGVSSFGFSGTNAHVIVEEYLDKAQSRSIEDRPYLFTLSAKTETALKSISVRLHRYLTDNPSILLADIARTLNMGRSHFEYRACMTAKSHKELVGLLSSFQKNHDLPAMHAGRARTHSSRVAFVFGGEQRCEGDFYRELYDFVPTFRESLLQCEEILRDELEKPLTSVLYPEAGTGIGNPPPAYKKVAEFALQYALAEVWRSCGIEPSTVLGVGVGEYVAACIAGVFSLEDGLHLAIADDGKNPTEFNERAKSVSYHPPQIPLITNLNTNVSDGVGSAEYWLRRSHVDIASSSTLSALAKEGCAANVYIGDSSELRKFAKNGENNLPGKWLASLGEGQSDCRQFLNAAASLYVLGCELDMSGLYRDVANTVSLPTYPFERERYWLDSANSGKNERRDSARRVELKLSADIDEWIYDLVWEPKPLSRKIPQMSTAGLDQLIGPMSITPVTPELMRVEHLTAAAMPIYATYIVQALQQMGLSPLPESAFTLEAISEQLKIILARRRVLARLLGILVEDGLVERSGDHFRFVDFRPRPDADGELQKFSAEYPECRIELAILRQCGEKLAAVLQGAYDPMQLVFSDGSIEEAEQIYQDSPVCRFFNEKTAKVVRAAVDQITGRPARILEIGGGTGATTVSILAELVGKNIEYTFTDVSAAFLPRARGKFSHVPSMNYRVLDIENDPADQHFEPGGYDIVIAANVLHATADLRRTMAHVRKLLAPGGFLALIEGVRPDRWLDLTFGLTDGWFRFIDLDLRPEHPLISAESWARVLSGAGMSSSRTISYVKEDGSLSQQTVIVAQANEDDATPTAVSGHAHRDWIIFSDEAGVGNALHTSLTAIGERCEIIRRPGSASAAASVFRKLQTRSDNGPLEIVYLWDMDASALIGSTRALTQATEVCGKNLTHLMQTLLARGNKAGHLWIATRGAQATDSFAPTIAGTVQSLTWGFGRVFGLEAPAQYRALIDIDPTMTPESAAADLLAELLADDKEDQIAYRDGQRLVARLKNTRLGDLSLKDSTPPDSSAVGLREDGSYLLTGGLGGVGLKLARWAAEQGAGHLVLLGRTGLGLNAGPFAEERSKAIREIQKLGGKVTVVEDDVSSEADMKVLFQRFGGELPPLRGVFHAATVVSGAELGNLTDEQMEAMFRPKVLGTWVLHELTKMLALDFFLVFSSTTSLLGAKGMAHYAAANQFVDAFAHYRRSVGLPMLSVNWGAWDVMRLASRKEQADIAETGILPMQSEKVFSVLGDLIASRRSQVMIANIDWDVLKPLFEAHRTRPLLEHLGNRHPECSSTNVMPIPAPANLYAAMGMMPEDRRKFIEAFVLEQTARVLGFRSGDFPPADVPLTDIGLDSLMAVDLKHRLQTGLGQELSPTIVFDYPTVSGMVGMLETMLWAAHGNAEDNFASSQKDEIRI
jgi:acyl transferase domain-containing protein/SAM-dependent methyltransferase/NADP-dependent 3-hydroxy acid dehydrogenase YdfG